VLEGHSSVDQLAMQLSDETVDGRSSSRLTLSGGLLGRDAQSVSRPGSRGRRRACRSRVVAAVHEPHRCAVKGRSRHETWVPHLSPRDRCKAVSVLESARFNMAGGSARARRAWNSLRRCRRLSGRPASIVRATVGLAGIVGTTEMPKTSMRSRAFSEHPGSAMRTWPLRRGPGRSGRRECDVAPAAEYGVPFAVGRRQRRCARLLHVVSRGSGERIGPGRVESEIGCGLRPVGLHGERHAQQRGSRGWICGHGRGEDGQPDSDGRRLWPASRRRG
jgi:hypothetical protein